PAIKELQKWEHTSMKLLTFLSANRRGLLTSLLTFLLLSAVMVQTAHAATFTVNNTADAPDANPGDGICATASGVCTLRAALQEANAAAGADTINVPAGTYTL